MGNDDRTKLVTPTPFKTGERGKIPGLVVLSGKAAGTIIGINAAEVVIGRANDADIIINGEGVSRRHLKLVGLSDGRIEACDLGSTNGTYVNGERITRRFLVEGDKIQIGAVAVLKFGFYDGADEIYQKRFFESATKDPLTGIYNRRYFDEHVTEEFGTGGRRERRCSLIMWDIDYFKKVNDTYGHAAGDYVLREIATLVNGHLRDDDLFARYGGEEFVIFLPGTEASGAVRVAAKIREAVEQNRFMYNNRLITVTVSLGVVSFTTGEYVSLKEVLTAADGLLYKAKKNGRNRIENSVITR